jgi:hypothetical protein
MIDFLLRAKRNCAAARRFLEHVIDLHPRRSPSTRAAPTRRPSRMSKPTAARKSKCARVSTSTRSSSRITGLSCASFVRWWASSLFAARAAPLPASRRCA